MRNRLNNISVVVLTTLLGCVSQSQIKRAVAKNPDIVFDAIEQNPVKFMETVKKASRDAQQIEADQQMEKDFANPKVPAIDATSAIRGPVDAPITIVEYSDFQCPYCRSAVDVMKKTQEKYKGKVRFIFKQLPLSFHPQAMPAAQMFEAIALQSTEKAYLFHDEIYEHQDEMKDKKDALLLELATKVGADVKQAQEDMKSDVVKKRIEADMAEAEKFDFHGTPSFLINGVGLVGVPPEDTVDKIIDRWLAKKPG